MQSTTVSQPHILLDAHVKHCNSVDRGTVSWIGVKVKIIMDNMNINLYEPVVGIVFSECV